MADVIAGLDRTPVVIGHSFGGLLAQILAGRGLATASVAIDPAPSRGVLPLPFSALKASFPVLGNPANYKRSVTLTFEQFRYGFANAVPEAEARELYDTFHVAAPGGRCSRRRPPTSTRSPRPRRTRRTRPAGRCSSSRGRRTTSSPGRWRTRRTSSSASTPPRSPRSPRSPAAGTPWSSTRLARGGRRGARLRRAHSRPSRLTTRRGGGVPGPIASAHVKTLVIGPGGREHAWRPRCAGIPRSPRCTPPPGTRAWRRSRRSTTSTRCPAPPSPRWPPSSGSTSSWSVPRRRWSRVSPTPSARAGSPASVPRRRPPCSRAPRPSPRT